MELIGIEGRFPEMSRQSGGHGNPPAARMRTDAGFPAPNYEVYTPRRATMCSG